LPAFPQTLAGFTNLDFDQTQAFKNEGVTKEQVRSVSLTSFTLSVDSPDTQGFDFLDDIEFFAQTGDREELIASRYDVQSLGLGAPTPTLALNVAGVELQPYVTAPTMNIIARGTGRYPASETTLRAHAIFAVQLQLF
jgi:hypothetical protein